VHREPDATLRAVKRLVLLLLVITLPSQALPPSSAKLLLERARKYLGTPYEFGGRNRLVSGGRREGIDCQGLVFLAAQALTKCSWKSFSNLNVEQVSRKELGTPVDGMAPIASADLELTKLEAGDSLMLVAPDQNPAEAPIGKLAEQDVWVWHVGLYAGDGKWVVGDHFAGAVVETDLKAYLAEHADVYSGVFVMRMASAPKPARCR
jgi:cell wall-associated NlpC family hydrolase